ncbi:MAG TPA: hypothetical protein VGU02_08765 [Gaiellaceae bacterium]|nr:hypothetical protein [Gaiellaceae bacterium]
MRTRIILSTALTTAAAAGAGAATYHGHKPLADIAFAVFVVSGAVAVSVAGAKLVRRVRPGTSVFCLVLAVFAVLIPAATAAASTLPKAKWVAKADAACRTIDARVAAIPQPKINPAQPQRSDLPKVAAYLTRLSPLLATEIARIAALPDPATDAALSHAFIRNARASLAAERASAAAAQRSDLSAYKASFVRDNHYGTQASTTAKRLGLRVCGQ